MSDNGWISDGDNETSVEAKELPAEAEAKVKAKHC